MMADTRALNDVKVDGQHIADAIGDLRHQARVLTLAILGTIASPNEIEGNVGNGRRDVDEDWRHDVEHLAWQIVGQIDSISAALEPPAAAGIQGPRVVSDRQEGQP